MRIIMPYNGLEVRISDWSKNDIWFANCRTSTWNVHVIECIASNDLKSFESPHHPLIIKVLFNLFILFVFIDVETDFFRTTFWLYLHVFWAQYIYHSLQYYVHLVIQFPIAKHYVSHFKLMKFHLLYHIFNYLFPKLSFYIYQYFNPIFIILNFISNLLSFLFFYPFFIFYPIQFYITLYSFILSFFTILFLLVFYLSLNYIFYVILIIKMSIIILFNLFLLIILSLILIVKINWKKPKSRFFFLYLLFSL